MLNLFSHLHWIEAEVLFDKLIAEKQTFFYFATVTCPPKGKFEHLVFGSVTLNTVQGWEDRLWHKVQNGTDQTFVQRRLGFKAHVGYTRAPEEGRKTLDKCWRLTAAQCKKKRGSCSLKCEISLFNLNFNFRFKHTACLQFQCKVTVDRKCWKGVKLIERSQKHCNTAKEQWAV